MVGKKSVKPSGSQTPPSRTSKRSLKTGINKATEVKVQPSTSVEGSLTSKKKFINKSIEEAGTITDEKGHDGRSIISKGIPLYSGVSHTAIIKAGDKGVDETGTLIETGSPTGSLAKKKVTLNMDPGSQGKLSAKSAKFSVRGKNLKYGLPNLVRDPRSRSIGSYKQKLIKKLLKSRGEDGPEPFAVEHDSDVEQQSVPICTCTKKTLAILVILLSLLLFLTGTTIIVMFARPQTVESKETSSTSIMLTDSSTRSTINATSTTQISTTTPSSTTMRGCGPFPLPDNVTLVAEYCVCASNQNQNLCQRCCIAFPGLDPNDVNTCLKACVPLSGG